MKDPVGAMMKWEQDHPVWPAMMMTMRGVAWFERMRKGRVYAQLMRSVVYALFALEVIDMLDHEGAAYFFRDMAIAAVLFLLGGAVAAVYRRRLSLVQGDGGMGLEGVDQVLWMMAQVAEEPEYEKERWTLRVTVAYLYWVLYAEEELLLTALIICVAAASAGIVTYGGFL